MVKERSKERARGGGGKREGGGGDGEGGGSDGGGPRCRPAGKTKSLQGGLCWQILPKMFVSLHVLDVRYGGLAHGM